MEQLTKVEQLGRLIGEWTHRQLDLDPAYYSGRGVKTNDLDSERLILVFQGVRKEYGLPAALAYIEMVRNIPLLTATDFTAALRNLGGFDFKCDFHSGLQGDTTKGIYVPKDENGKYGRSSTMTGFVAIVATKGRDLVREKQVSDRMKAGFLGWVYKFLYENEEFEGQEQYLTSLKETLHILDPVWW